MRSAALLLVLAAACKGGMSPATPDASPSVDASADAVPADAPMSPFSFVPASIDFGFVATGTNSAPIHISVVNNAGVDISGFALSLSGDDTIELLISQTTCTSTLSAGAGCSMDMEFAPRADGDHTMAITAMAPGQISATASIHAAGGIAPHPFGTSISSLDFGTVTVGSTYGQVVTYKNSGTTTLPPISFMFAGESPDQYQLADDQCTGVQLAPMTTCTVTVVYAPTSLNMPGDAILYGTAVNTSELDLRGGPSAATTLSISPTSYDYGNVGPAPSGNAPFTITNTGSVTATGFGSSIFNTQYAVTSSTCTSLAPGDSCVMNVQLSPAAAATGPDNGGMTVTSDNATSASTGFTAIAIPAEGVILDTWSHDFGTAVTGTIGSSYTFTATNVGTTATSVTLSLDDDVTAFEIANDNCSATSLAAGSSCTFDIVFTPMIATSHFARVHATSSSNDAIAHLTGVSTPGDQPLHVIPGDYNYSTDAIGQILDEQFTVASQGGTTKVPTMSLTGTNASEFEIVNDNCTGVSLTSSGQSCTVDVWYRPATVGTKSAGLVATWATGSTTATLSGGAFEDTNAFISSDPPWFDFGTVTVGQSASVTLPFTNHGATTSPPMSFQLGGINNTEFSVPVDNCTGVVLANGDTCTITVMFSPASAGTKHADVQVTVGDGGDTQLTGVGQ